MADPAASETRRAAGKPARFRPRVSVVVPAFNEEGNVATLAARVAEALKAHGTWELIFVDDGSSDATLARVKALAASLPRVRYVSFTRNFGHQAALRAGLRHAEGAAVVLMDCDLEHPPELIPQLLAAWEGGAKVVTTRRASDPARAGFFKRASSALYYRLLDAIGDVRIEEGSADFMLLDRVAVDDINRFESADVFLRGLVRWLGYPMATVPYDQGVREAGKSKFTARRMIDFAVSGIVSHSLKPLRVAIYVSAAFAFAGVGLLIYSLVSFLWIARTVAGWTSLMAAIAILGAGQFFMLGVIGEYIGRVLRETRKWPSYLVAETETSTPSHARDAAEGV